MLHSDHSNRRVVLKLALHMLLVLICLGCTQNDGAGPDGMSWKEWAESSDTGLWEDNEAKSIRLNLVRTYDADIADGDLLFTSIEAFHVSGDTIFIADGQKNELVTLDSEGNLLWRFGSGGEGPGHFSGIGQIASSDACIAVTNRNNSRIELVSRNGTYLGSLPVLCPYDICFINDTTLVIITDHESGGLIHLRSLSGEVIADFGEWETDYSNIWMNRNYHSTLSAENTLFISSYYEDIVVAASIDSSAMQGSMSRNLPMEIPESQISSNGERMSFTLFPIILDICIGIDGNVNVLLRPVDADGGVDKKWENNAPVSIVDRFSLSGNYLDSYIIPMSAGQVLFVPPNRLYASNEWEGSLYMYEITRTE